MIYAVLGLTIGALLGFLAPGYIPKMYASYFSVALMSGLDTVFLSGFFINMLVAVFFCYAGNLLNINFYLIVILVLGMRVFNNLAIIRRLYLDEKEKEAQEKEKGKGAKAD